MIVLHESSLCFFITYWLVFWFGEKKILMFAMFPFMLHLNLFFSMNLLLLTSNEFVLLTFEDYLSFGEILV